VIRIEPEHNRVVLGSENELYSQGVIVSDLRWIRGEAPRGPIAATAKIRYKSKETAATLSPEGGSPDIWFSQPQRAVTPGQAIVFYKDNEVLGGGTIESSQPITVDDEKKEYITAT
jgi:tRNA-specific 2-thiouridylase